MNRIRTGFSLIELLVVIAIIAILAAILFPIYTSARDKARATYCMNSMKQIGTAHTMYIDDYGGVLVPVGVTRDEKATIFPVADNSATYWPDLLRGYTPRKSKIHKCPSAAKHFGIGMNHPQLGRWATNLGAAVCRFSEISYPGKTVCFGDTGLIVNNSEEYMDKPDTWYEDKTDAAAKALTIVFRTPDNKDGSFNYYRDEPTRMVNRHNGMANCAFLDGHCQAMPVSKVGFQYPYGHPLALWDTR